MYAIKKILNPEMFQGENKTKNYFEGWYYKIVDRDETHSFAFIPGIAFDENREGHSFIQIIDSIQYHTEYFKFPFSSFEYSKEVLDVSIDGNNFKNNGLKVDLNNNKYSVKGSLDFINIEAFPKTLTRPGIMGPFSFVPFMECYHGVVNIHHEIKGGLSINDEFTDFTGGYGYIEKDWGKSFPKWWVWIQSNHFTEERVSMMFAIAKIPWLHRHFTGFISFLKIKDEMYTFATYTGGKVRKLEYTDGNIDIIVQDRKYELSITGTYDEGGVLKAPKNGLMERMISESISSMVKVTLKDKDGNIIFDDYGKNAGLEVVGKHLKK